jgi:hypothetical protein
MIRPSPYAYWPAGGWPPFGRILCFQLLLISNNDFEHCPPDHVNHPQRCPWLRVGQGREARGVHVNSMIRGTKLKENITNQKLT